MRSFQVRLADEVHERLREIAAQREAGLADLIREALEVYSVGVLFAQQGKRLFWEDTRTGEKAEVLIPGFTRYLISGEEKRTERAERSRR